MWKLNHRLLNNQWIKEEIKRNKKQFEASEKKDTTYQNLYDAAKAVFREKNYQLQIPRLGKKNDINNLTYYLKTLEKEEKTTSKTGRRKETMKNRAELIKWAIVK